MHFCHTLLTYTQHHTADEFITQCANTHNNHTLHHALLPRTTDLHTAQHSWWVHNSVCQHTQQPHTAPCTSSSHYWLTHSTTQLMSLPGEADDTTPYSSQRAACAACAFARRLLRPLPWKLCPSTRTDMTKLLVNPSPLSDTRLNSASGYTSLMIITGFFPLAIAGSTLLVGDFLVSVTSVVPLSSLVSGCPITCRACFAATCMACFLDAATPSNTWQCCQTHSSFTLTHNHHTLHHALHRCLTHQQVWFPGDILTKIKYTLHFLKQ